MNRSIIAAVASAFVAALAVACTVPNQSGSGEGGSGWAATGRCCAPAGEAASGGGDLCARACNRFVACNLDRMDSCMEYCGTGAVATERLEIYAASSCEDLVSYMRYGAPAGQTGQGCVTRGANDCPHMMTCCGGDEATGTPGQCIDAAICYGPRR